MANKHRYSIKNKINIDVNLASHTHQIPQVGLPHNDPVKIEIKVNTIPMGAKLFAIRGKNLILKTKFKIEDVPIVAKIPKAINDDGTCTYIILTESPCI